MQVKTPVSVAIINAKGGAGKTTFATNLASFYASRNLTVVLKDYDPQGSSSEWHRTRPFVYPEINLVNCVSQKASSTLSWQRRIPQGTDVIILDTPAAVDLNRMLVELKSVSKIIVPVMPSPIDIRATALFIRDLYKFLKIHQLKMEVAVVASRVKEASPLLGSLERIFHNLDIPFAGSIAEHGCYIRAAEHGVGVFEMPDSPHEQLAKSWKPVLDWLGLDTIDSDSRSRPELFVV